MGVGLAVGAAVAVAVGVGVAETVGTGDVEVFFVQPAAITENPHRAIAAKPAVFHENEVIRVLPIKEKVELGSNETTAYRAFRRRLRRHGLHPRQALSPVAYVILRASEAEK